MPPPTKLVMLSTVFEIVLEMDCFISEKVLSIREVIVSCLSAAVAGRETSGGSLYKLTPSSYLLNWPKHYRSKEFNYTVHAMDVDAINLV